jgi:putative hydrolase of the HAD superfamily
VHEKDAATYHDLIGKHRIVKSLGWMVGNSPRSDINPALECGLNAVFIPHSATWELEHAALQTGTGTLMVLSSFRDLRQHF